jgi:anti-sigma regulatory factor (Ser/Thr protein kinase)
VHHRYAPVSESCLAARDDLRAFLRPHVLDHDLVQDVVLVLNELVANAVDHARTTFAVRASVTGHAVRIEVEDGSTEPPRLQPRDPSSSRGHGLRIVDGLAATWSVTRTVTGKTIHADLAVA